MVSKQLVKFIKSLQYKKYRRKANAFLVEGEKSVVELLRSDYSVQSVIATPEFYQKYEKELLSCPCGKIEAGPDDLAKIGSYQSNNGALAVAGLKQPATFNTGSEDHILALEGIRDPGNLGTIIRTADWFGFYKIIASPDTVDMHNPKVISATRGSFTRVDIWYTEIGPFLDEHPGVHAYGAFLEGESLYKVRINPPSVIVLGNESQGIAQDLQSRIRNKVTIPRVGAAESLNVGVAAAIICDHIRRNQP